MSGSRSAWVPVGIGVVAAVYLWNLLAIRATHATDYNDYFAIPVTVLVLAGCLAETLRALVRDRRSDVRELEQEAEQPRTAWQRSLDNPRLRLAALLVLFLLGFGRIPFVLLSAAFLTVSVAVVAPHPHGRSVRRLVGFYAGVVAASFVLSVALFTAFTELGARL